MQSRALNGLDSLLSIVQMPAGIPVATVAIGEAGAKNAAILAAQIVARKDSPVAQFMAIHSAKEFADAIGRITLPAILANLVAYRAKQTQQSIDSEADLV